MNLSDAIKVYIGASEVSKIFHGNNQSWMSGGDSFLYGQISTQVDAGAISSQSMGLGVPSTPVVVVSTLVIAETPVNNSTLLSVPSTPVVVVSTSVQQL